MVYIVNAQRCINSLIPRSDRNALFTAITVTLTMDTNIGLFGEFASFPVTLRAQAAGKSEVYWK